MPRSRTGGVAADIVEIGVVFDPFAVTEAVRDGPLEQVEGPIPPAGHRVEAGHVVQHAGVVGVECQGLVTPLKPPLDIARRHRQIAPR